MTLERLLNLSGVSKWDRYVWFRGCTLQGHLLIAPDDASADSLERCWVPQLMPFLTDIQVRVGEPERPQTVYRGQLTSQPRDFLG